MKHGKKYTDSRKLVDSTKLYEPAEALDLCAKTGKAKFDETVESMSAWAWTAVTPTSRSAAP